jgi:hypothetical protein
MSIDGYSNARCRDEDVQQIIRDRHCVKGDRVLGNPVELFSFAMEIENKKQLHEILSSEVP